MVAQVVRFYDCFEKCFRQPLINKKDVDWYELYTLSLSLAVR